MTGEQREVGAQPLVDLPRAGRSRAGRDLVPQPRRRHEQQPEPGRARAQPPVGVLGVDDVALVEQSHALPGGARREQAAAGQVAGGLHRRGTAPGRAAAGRGAPPARAPARSVRPRTR